MRLALTIFLTLFTGAITFLAYAWVADRQHRHRRMSLVAHAALRRHILRTDDRVQAICEYLGVEISEPVADDSPGHEAELYEEPETQPIPVQRPETPTEPMERVLVDKWAEDVPDTLITDVELAWALAELEDKIRAWRTKEAA